METLEKPKPIQKYRKFGGELEYSLFKSSSMGIEAQKEAIRKHIKTTGTDYWKPDFNPKAFEQLNPITLSKDAFFGDWYNPNRKMLKLLGNGYLNGFGDAENPDYDLIHGCKIVHWAGPGIEPGDRGQYAYAFSRSVHSMWADYSEIQQIFDQINSIVLPHDHDNYIIDWNSKKLSLLSSYFDSGMEWWGVFLFTITTPDLSQIVVISGSSTD